MRQTVKPIITEVGKIWGRDAVFYDAVKKFKKINNLLKIDETNNNRKHFIFRTYDTVFEIIAMGYKLELGASRLNSTKKA